VTLNSEQFVTHRPTPSAFDLRSLYDATGPEALSLHERYINPAYAAVLKTIGFDALYERAEGPYLFDRAGNRYIDCLGGYAVFACGRNHPVLKDAIRQYLDLDSPNLPGIGTFRLAGVLARELARIMPGGDSPDGLTNAFFTSAGGEAMDAALKMARAATGRTRIIYCSRAYHGLTLGALALNGNHEFREGFGPLMPGAVEIPFNDLAALERELAAGDVAAFVVEPIQGKGVHVPHADYLREAARLCGKHGALLAIDEVQTGLGRTGRWLACEHDGAGQSWMPDMVIIAKALSGGFAPVGAVMTRPSIHAKVFASMQQCARIQTTFGMNDLSMVAGLATLHVIREERLVEQAARVGSRLAEGLRASLAGMELFKEVRGRGLMLAVEFQRPRSLTLKAQWDLMHTLDKSLFCQAILMPMMSEHRVLAQVAGHAQDVIKLIPPLVLSEQDADDVTRAMSSAAAACHKLTGPAWEVGRKLGAAALRRFGMGRRDEPAG